MTKPDSPLGEPDQNAPANPPPPPGTVSRAANLVSNLAAFLSPRSLQGPLLLLALILAMVMVNSPLAWLYDELLGATFEIRLEGFGLQKPLLLWINDGLMALFFLLVAIEIKHERIEGHLARMSQVTLPLVCALFGVAVPAGVYLLVAGHDPVARNGWPIPAATDIAFSLAVLGAFGTRAPRSLTAFLMALAVFDDLMAILIIAVFYAGNISLTAHVVALVLTLVLFVLNRLRVASLGAYFLVGLCLWVAVLKSGVHATLAGVVIGFAIPYRGRRPDAPSPMKELEHRLHPWVALLVLPVFAFANSGVSLAGFSLQTLQEPVTLGIAAGLVLGKTLGVFAAAAALIRLRLVPMPEGASWPSLLGTCAVSGIGFTMSMFLGSLAFEGQEAGYAGQMRLGVILGSAVAAAVGIGLLHGALPRARPAAVA